ncbi:MAG TPA: succinate dehydrogenase cytochrome b subunit [Opitutaceae bacterium]|nr:succinate dehydrogenase cytochrome b subunit [Opitutaceae bacterium]
MKSGGSFFCSSIGRKILMAVSGIILIAFIIGHLVGNLQIFQGPDHLNGYAVFLRQMGPTLWIARIVILASVVIHIWAATALTLENRAARGAEPYTVKHTIRATLASRTMRITGYVVLAFVLYHLAQFTWGWVQPDTFKENLHHYQMQADYRVAGLVAVHQGTDVENVYNMVVLGFSQPLIALFYIVAIGLLSFHLLHGFDSMFQTLGLRSTRWARGLRVVTILFCLGYFLGNLAIPGAVLLHRLKPYEAPIAAATPSAANR